MKVVRTKAELREALSPERRAGRSIGLVPTMGYLHRGHLSLLEEARRCCDVVVLSLFVNPTQFRPGEDLESYPRDFEGDRESAERAGVDLLYAPSVSEVYAEGHRTAVVVEGLTDVLCGDPASRGAEHFRGVTTVVAKLFNAVDPDIAFFGQKDAQQALVIRRMTADLDFDVEIAVLPTIREPDGLAMSSRNAYLSERDRARAPAIHAALSAARGAAADGVDADRALAAARAVLAEAGIEPEYLEARDAETLEPIETFNGRPVLVAIAAPLGGARLIDNEIIEPSAPAAAAGGPNDREAAN
jgi:pantoate--beta-alanine ligase